MKNTILARLLRVALCAVVCLALMPLAGLNLAWADEGNDTGGASVAAGAPDPEGGLADEGAAYVDDDPGLLADDGAADPDDDAYLPDDMDATDDPDGLEGSVLAEDPAADLITLAPLAGLTPPTAYSVQYRAHVQGAGWMGWTAQGKTAGTTGKGLRLEALQVKLNGSGLSGSVQYQAKVQGTGWQDLVKNGKTAGTTGKGLRAEVVRIELTGQLATVFDIYYRVHVQHFGWLGWAFNGTMAGTSGYGYRIEAIEVKLVPKGEPPVGDISYKKKPMDLEARAHVQSKGWLAWTTQGKTAGTTGKGLRMEALCLKLTSKDYSGSVEYRAYSTGKGWLPWQKNGAVAGTTGQGRSMQAVQIRLTGKMATNYDVYYRAYVAKLGWLSWTKNGASAGTLGLSTQMEALQVALVKKGGKAPGATATPFVQMNFSTQGNVSGKGWLSAVKGRGVTGTTGQSRQLEAFTITVAGAHPAGSVEYNAYVQGTGWQGWKKDGAVAGIAGGGKRIEAIRVRLAGDLATYFDVFYRAHVGSYGWMGWAKNGGSAGTTTIGLRVEAFELAVVPKGAGAPGSTYWAYTDYSSGDLWLDNQIRSICAAHKNNLQSCFNYVAGFRYRTASLYPTGNWAVPLAHDMLVNNSGNCYRYAALFCCIAKQLGYDATVVSGAVPSVSAGRAPHGWVEIRKDGKTYVCDPCLANSYTGINWYMITYGNAPIAYYR